MTTPFPFLFSADVTIPDCHAHSHQYVCFEAMRGEKCIFIVNNSLKQTNM